MHGVCYIQYFIHHQCYKKRKKNFAECKRMLSFSSQLVTRKVRCAQLWATRIFKFLVSQKMARNLCRRKESRRATLSLSLYSTLPQPIRTFSDPRICKSGTRGGSSPRPAHRARTRCAQLTMKIQVGAIVKASVVSNFRKAV